MTTKVKGYRAGTRSKFSKPFRRRGAIRMTKYLQRHRIGDIVDIVVDGAIHRGMPHNFYHGKTGRVFNVNPRSIGVSIQKVVRNRKIEKRLNIRSEHLVKSRSRENFLSRIKANDQKKAEAKKNGKRISTKRSPALPSEAQTVKFDLNAVKVTNPIPYMEIH